MTVKYVKVTFRVPDFIPGELAQLKRNLSNDEDVDASRESIVAALIHGVTAAQLAGMLPAYVRHRNAQDDQDTVTEADDVSGDPDSGVTEG